MNRNVQKMRFRLIGAGLGGIEVVWGGIEVVRDGLGCFHGPRLKQESFNMLKMKNKIHIKNCELTKIISKYTP